MEKIRKITIYLSNLSCIICAVLLINSCKMQVKAGYIDDDKKSTETEIEKFHSRISSQDYEDIYNNSSPSFQKSVSKLDAIKAMEVTQEDCGQFDNIIDKRINVIVGTPVQIRAVYSSKYSKRNVTEEFIFVKEDDQIKLVQYQKFNGITTLPDL
jgi:hypothetical protein